MLKIFLLVLATLLLLLVLYVVWLLGGISFLMGGRLSLVRLVTSNGVRLDSVEFDTPWEMRKNDSTQGHYITNVVRYNIRASDTEPAELLFRVVENSLGEPLSDNIFGISHVRPQPREATEKEWKTAKQLPSTHAPIFKTGTKGLQTREVTYAGKTFVSTGPALRVALPSPDGKWLAMLSETIEDQNQAPRIELLPFLGSDHPREGDSFLDLYNVLSGLLVASGKTHYSPRGGLMLRSESVWMGNRFFITPTNEQFSSCVVARITDLQGSR